MFYTTKAGQHTNYYREVPQTPNAEAVSDR